MAGTTVGPAHKQPLVNEWLLVGTEWSSQVESKVKGKILSFSQRPFCSPGLQRSWGPGNRLEAVSPGRLQSPHQGHPMWSCPHPHLCNLTGYSSVQDTVQGAWPPSFGCPEELEGQLGPGCSFLSHGIGTGLGPGPEEPPSEICFFSQDLDLRGETCAWGPCLSCQNGEWHLLGGDLQKHRYLTTDLDLKNTGYNTKQLATTNHAPPLPFLQKGFCWKFLGVWDFLKCEPPSPAWHSINLSLFQTPVVWYCLASLCIRHMGSCFVASAVAGHTSCFWL